jgi:superfamily II DNA or RNA helicase
MNLRPYQTRLKVDIYAAWNAGHKNVLAVLPTGGGKTVIFSTVLAEQGGACVAIAHRSELVSQMSLSLARNGVRHRVIGTPALARTCGALHVAEIGKSFVSPQARTAVASVDTLVKRDADEPWFKEVQLWITDEAAHLLEQNKWGRAVAMFPNARGLGVTATPSRADGQGLGAHADGVMHAMVQGPEMRQLINDGWLTDYRIFAPKSDIDLMNVPISANGDYSPPKLAEAVHSSHIVGDCVQHYKSFADGKLCVMFCVDVESATESAQAFKTAGVRAEVITGTTPDMMRQEILRKFRNGEVKVLCSIDVFSEGFDLPAIEVVIMARPTQSFGLYAQQFGRSVRLMDGKTHAIIIDAVGNTMRHGLPDRPRVHTLDRRERRTRNAPDDVIPLRTCTKCAMVYERIYDTCPYCGTVRVIADRSVPEAVDGQLSEFSPELLARLRGEIDKPITVPYDATPIVVASVKKHHRERQDAQRMLRGLMSYYGGWRTVEGDDVAMQQRRFFITYNIDVLSAMALNKADAIALAARVMATLREANVEFTLDTGE